MLPTRIQPLDSPPPLYCLRLSKPSISFHTCLSFLNDILNAFIRSPPNTIQITLSTAHPAKFAEAVARALSNKPTFNFERLLWYLAYESSGSGDRTKACETLANWMGKVKSDGKVEVPTDVLELAKKDFVAERISDEQVNSHLPNFSGLF